MRNLRKLALSLLLLLLGFLRLGFFKGIKVTFVVVQLLTLELDDLVDNLIQEISGMRNDHNSDIQTLNILLKPNKSNKIQMIGGFIQQ